ncbi:beta-1,3-glucan-binding protein [Folsomia candida]|uniref:Beta-1,3-glucan-binding protein n=1 Tax=Folsomia candida TaxID=158441 RepID=A0A226DNH2_FOLCA|nr:beta-1,3-glucan-binding protein [Folsomia candida]OXA47082.1 Beta-1,3-glucan-binding protein [Folsomia candida]
MKVAFVFCSAIVAVLASGRNVSISTSSTNKGGVYAPGDLMFEDTFDRFDLSVWQHEITMSGGGNWEFQVYSNTRFNSYTRDGILYLMPTLTNDRWGENFVETGTLSLLGGAPADECTNPAYYGCERSGAGGNIINPAMSARIRTVNSFSFKYGKVEVRAKIPAGDWLWPAIWMLPRHNSYGTWPASGEIDIMESRGNKRLFNLQGVNIGTEQISYTSHYGPYFPYNGYANAHYETQAPPDQGYDTAFHVYAVEWTDTYIRHLLDGVVVGTTTPPPGGFWELGGFPNDVHNPWTGADNPRMAPFDQEFYILLNVAVGGTNGFFPDDVQPPKPWRNDAGNAFAEFWAARNAWHPTWAGENAAMQIDYVRITAV